MLMDPETSGRASWRRHAHSLNKERTSMKKIDSFIRQFEAGQLTRRQFVNRLAGPGSDGFTR